MKTVQLNKALKVIAQVEMPVSYLPYCTAAKQMFQHPNEDGDSFLKRRDKIIRIEACDHVTIALARVLEGKS